MYVLFEYWIVMIMSTLQTNLSTDTWIDATWDEYIQAIEDPVYKKSKCYYYNGKLRIEMPPVGNDHASDHWIIIHAVHLFAGQRIVSQYTGCGSLGRYCCGVKLPCVFNFSSRRVP